ncbi:aminopeptidase [Nitrospira sp.]|nr:aminopeptidase [Nitrospira sp.]
MSSTRSTATDDPFRDKNRLPRHIRPSRYDLSFAPDFATDTFEGQASITLTVTRPAREILLNAVDLEISEASLSGADSSPQPARIQPLSDIERCRLILSHPIQPGSWVLRMRFRGQLNDQLHGFYRSSFTDVRGARQTLAVTQFEAADARRAFPCWDEPDFKAVFSLTLVVDQFLTALSNTQAVSHIRQGQKTIIQFADTIVMPTYLLAFVVGRLEGTAATYVGQTPIRVWTVPGKTHLAAYGQELAAFSLRFFEEYYGLPYPGDKLDLIAIPDFSHGAMENLGAITFRESALLVDPARATHGELEGLADVVCHENAHMWFGDLVTMSWWNGLWLNEAFATFLEVVAVDVWKPEWKRWDAFALARASAMSIDGLHASRAVEFPVRAVKDLGAMFDVLTYQKGAAVLRMLEQYLGPTVFRDGVRQYLQTHAYGNTETVDLWNALGEASQQPIADVMHQWVFAPGYPLLTVSLNRQRRLTVRQQRFTYLKQPASASGKTRKTTALWQVPLQLSVSTSHETLVERRLLDSVEAQWPLPSDFDAVLLNPGGHGYYRVRYAPELLERLLAKLPDGLPPIDRFNLINDAWAMCCAGLTPVGEYLDLTTRFANDPSPHVWSILLSSFERIDAGVAPADRAGYERILRARLAGKIAHLGWTARPDDDDLTRELRGDMIATLGTLANDPATQAQANILYGEVRDGSEAVDPNLIPALIDIVAFTGDERRYDEFFDRFQAAQTPQDERRYLIGLTGFRSATLVTRTLERSLSEDIRAHDGATVIGALLSSTHGRDLAWAFVKKQWATLSTRFPANGLRRLFAHLPSHADAALERDVHRFVKRQRIDLGGKAMAQTLEQLRIAVAFRGRAGPALHRYVARISSTR